LGGGVQKNKGEKPEGGKKKELVKGEKAGGTPEKRNHLITRGLGTKTKKKG